MEPDNALPPPSKLESQKNTPKTNTNVVAVTPRKPTTVPALEIEPVNTMVLPVPPPLPVPTSMDDVLRTPKQAPQVETLPTLP